ncbi:MAG TPA: hypothetical protein VGC31_01625, partial [Paenirhodobacter sp.]
MTAESTPAAPPAAPRSSRPRTGEGRAKTGPKTPAKGAAKDPATMSPADLVAGPCALPDAPLAMPQQVIEPARGPL